PTILRSVIAAITGVRPVGVYLPVVDDGADQVHAEFRAWLVDRLCAAHIELDRPPGPASTLRHIQRGDREASGPAPSPADQTVRIASAPDPAREVRAALRQCLGWAREGVRFHEMAIAYRQSDPYRTLISATLREAGLPAYMHEGTPMAELPLGRRT